MKLTETNRGFSLFNFTDRYGQKCSLQASSLATESCVWLGVDVDLDGNDIRCRMHLTQEMVKELLPHLQNFVDNGSIVIPIKEKEYKYYYYSYVGVDDEGRVKFSRGYALTHKKDCLSLESVRKMYEEENLNITILYWREFESKPQFIECVGEKTYKHWVNELENLML